MKGFNIIGRALDKWNAEPSDGAPLPSRDKRKPAAMMLATGLQRQSGCPDDLTTWHMKAPPGGAGLDPRSTTRHFAAATNRSVP